MTGEGAPTGASLLAGLRVAAPSDEDFQGNGTSGLPGFLEDLAALARRADARGEHLYCLASV
jgi:hypothetical protein